MADDFDCIAAAPGRTGQRRLTRDRPGDMPGHWPTLATQSPTAITRQAMPASMTLSLLHAAGVPSLALQCNVADAGACERFFAETIERFGQVDVLVNNAGITRDAPLATMRPGRHGRRVIDTNLTGIVPPGAGLPPSTS